MNNLYPHVTAPVRVAGHLLKNRLICAPSTIHTSSNGEPYPTEDGIRFYEARARAGAGLVTCAGVSVGGAFDDGVHCSWDVTIPNHTHRLCELAERIHFYGAKCTMELMGVLPDGWTCSGVDCAGTEYTACRGEAPRAVLDSLKQAYIDTAVGIMRCGFDGILLHFGHSIPIAQFLSPLTNTRTDEYGGSTENRCRYPREILEGIRAAIGRDPIIEVRISGAEFEPGGIDLEEGIKIAGILQTGADIIQVSAGMQNKDWAMMTYPSSFLPPMPNVYLAEAFKKSGRIGKYISTVGGIVSLADADAIIAAGKADFVAMARAFIADIDVIRKGAEGRQADVVPCVKCMHCHDSDTYGRRMVCTVNPRVGMERVLEGLPSAGASKNVAVVGGGPAGMTAALTAVERGHHVTLFEQSDALGGKLKFADYVPFKYALANYKNYLIGQIGKSDVCVRLNTQATPEMLGTFDAVIAAVGADAIVPPIPGIENALRAEDIYGHEPVPEARVVVIGGGQVGIETALHLARRGNDVTVIEMRPEPAPDAAKTHRDELMVELRRDEERLHIVTSARCTNVSADGVAYEKDGVSRQVTADIVILAAGMRARSELADRFMGITDAYAQAGDCVRARTVEYATREGFFAAMRL